MSGRGHRAGAPRPWTPVGQLSELARVLLSDDLGGRDAVPGHVADRVTALAAQWSAAGFTARTVRPWSDLTPACAAYLAGRGVEPDQLDRPVDAGAAPGSMTVRQALSTGRLDAEQAYETLVSGGMLVSGGDRPSAVRGHAAPFGPSPEPPASRSASPPAVPAPVVFSHPAADHAGEDDRDVPGGASGRPSRTPFRP